MPDNPAKVPSPSFTFSFDSSWPYCVRFICFLGRKYFNVNPIDTGIFFDACVPGGVKNHTPLKITFFLHEVKFCINSVLFLCTVLFSSSVLMNFSDFGYKMTENSNFFEN